ncbi:helix-turn-helix domain-containing protein [Rhizobium sp. LEGMi198b]
MQCGVAERSSPARIISTSPWLDTRVELISTIAFEAGFSDLSYFQRTFRRAFGNTPRDYLSGIAERVHIDLDASLNRS